LAIPVLWIPLTKNERRAFSMVDIKALYNNKLAIRRYLAVLDNTPAWPKNKEKIGQLINYRARAV